MCPKCVQDVFAPIKIIWYSRAILSTKLNIFHYATTPVACTNDIVMYNKNCMYDNLDKINKIQSMLNLVKLVCQVST